MNELTEIENQFFQLFEGSIRPDQFEKWIYNCNKEELRINEEDYLNLISINYTQKTCKYEVRKIVEKYVDYRKYQIIKLLETLDLIENDQLKYQLCTNEFGRLLFPCIHSIKNTQLTINASIDSLINCLSRDESQSRDLINKALPPIKILLESIKKWIKEKNARVIIKQDFEDSTWWGYGKKIQEMDSEVKITIRNNKRHFDLRVNKNDLIQICKK